jgi:hypothetical protein
MTDRESVKCFFGLQSRQFLLEKKDVILEFNITILQFGFPGMAGYWKKPWKISMQ